MARPRFDKLPAEHRQAIIDAAARAFAEKGYAGASLNNIIELLGLSKGSFYYYFDDKKDLFLTVLEAAYARSMNFVGDFPAPATAQKFWQQAEELDRRGMQFMLEDPVLYGVIRAFSMAITSGQLQLSQEDFDRPHRQMQLEFIKAGQDCKAIRRDLPEDLLIVLIEAVFNAFYHWLAQQDDSISQRECNLLQHKMFRMIRLSLEPDPQSTEVLS